MFLIELEVNNYRSLEHVKLERFNKFNVLVGRNNAGKSSIFGSLSWLNRVIHGQANNSENILTDKDTSRALAIRLVFSLNETERAEIISRLCATGPWAGRIEPLRESAFFRLAEFQFAARVGSPTQLHLQFLRVRGEDNEWCEIEKNTDRWGSTGPKFAATNIAALMETTRGALLGQNALPVGVGPQMQQEYSPNFGTSV
jgi:hypothetical protein